MYQPTDDLLREVWHDAYQMAREAERLAFDRTPSHKVVNRVELAHMWAAVLEAGVSLRCLEAESDREWRRRRELDMMPMPPVPDKRGN